MNSNIRPQLPDRWWCGRRAVFREHEHALVGLCIGGRAGQSLAHPTPTTLPPNDANHPSLEATPTPDRPSDGVTEPTYTCSRQKRLRFGPVSGCGAKSLYLPAHLAMRFRPDINLCVWQVHAVVHRRLTEVASEPNSGHVCLHMGNNNASPSTRTKANRRLHCRPQD